ncbi:uncharacterized protein M421DRAFT_95944 [Didymella exigua CBS 183.55]|uniref:FAD/NAD(P)-binding domain-containing protein n=1 Tax=Didymella exigua CBS 183.55 TaxID=1150837 RepID=A0A6A5R8X2_9PLEO|nr:uncharacterized protein M421DRAFT_95944 [Didymella exigua CBS 183.55]KAF1923670.1 hypothetical protein M421DRAFT_95944 [Didymella exigua CBS 183.55]
MSHGGWLRKHSSRHRDGTRKCSGEGLNRTQTWSAYPQLPRGVNGKPIDHTLSLHLFATQSWIITNFLILGSRMFDKFVKSLQDKSFKLRHEWGFEPAQVIPIVSDYLFDYLEKGLIESIRGIKRITSDTEVGLEDGKILDVDAIMWCTGYQADFSMLEPRFDPTSCAVAEWSRVSGSNGRRLARICNKVFSLSKPDGLAFLGNVHTTLAGFQLFDMASMAIAQV